MPTATSLAELLALGALAVLGDLNTTSALHDGQMIGKRVKSTLEAAESELVLLLHTDPRCRTCRCPQAQAGPQEQFRFKHLGFWQSDTNAFRRESASAATKCEST